ncbi:hypothetical protein [Burkholderia sp. MSMB1589WGS]|uniref:hypothetical protein n=1 Tax=Burkholderia sp. MSMB1589WGS TaxID=1636425 RepID=UPI000AF39878|nr:hypothetical protein [Burkholderia sp. MSMB1589WGS]
MLEFSGSVRRPAACAGRLAVQFDKSAIRESRWFGPSAARANRQDEKKTAGFAGGFSGIRLRFARHHPSRSASGLRYQKK